MTINGRKPEKLREIPAPIHNESPVKSPRTELESSRSENSNYSPELVWVIPNEYQPKLNSSDCFSEHSFLKLFINSGNEIYGQTDGYDLSIMHSFYPLDTVNT